MQTVWCLISGFFGGILGGMGMGGGTLLIPILVLFLGVEQHLAQAVNLISFIPMAIFAIAIHFKNKLIRIKQIWHITLLSALGSVCGCFLSNKISANMLSKILGAFLVLLAVFQFIMLVINQKKHQKN